MDTIILPALIYIIGACLIPFLKGKTKKAFLVLVPLIVLVEVLLIKAPMTGWRFSYLDFTITLFYADRLSMLMGYIFSIIGFLCILYSLHVEDDQHHVFTFLYVGAALGVVYAGDFFSFLVFWEIMAITGAGIIWVKRDEKAVKAGFRYVMMHVIGGAVLMAGILVHYASTGSIVMGPVESGIAAALILFGIGLNAAFIPIHTWLPDGYPSAPLTGSIFLCVFTTKSAVYALARTSHGPSMFVAYMGGLMAVYGVTFALMQGNARKLLSYHVISQVGYMVAAVGIGTAIGVNGAFFHVFNHILYKSLLFMCIGAVIYRTGIEDLKELGGLARKMPITTLTAIVAAASISGVPFFNGFASKGLIFEGAHNIHGLYILLEIAAVGTFLSFCKFIYFGFLRKRDVELDVSDPPLHMSLSMAITAFMCFFIGVYPPLVATILPFETPFHYYGLGHLFGAFLLLGTTAVIFWKGKNLFAPHKWVIRDFDRIYRRAATGFFWLCNVPGVKIDRMINRGYEGGSRKLMTVAIPATEFDRVIDNAYVGTGKRLVETAAPATEFDRMIDKGYIKTGEKLVDAVGPPATEFDKMIDKGYVETGEKFVDSIGRGKVRYEPGESEFFDVKSEEEFRLFGRYSVTIPSFGERMPLKKSEGIFFEFTNHVAAFDLKVIDGVVNLCGMGVWGISKISDIFDIRVVDGTVNGIADALHVFGSKLRKPETGIIHDYASAVIMGVIALGIVILT